MFPSTLFSTRGGPHHVSGASHSRRLRYARIIDRSWAVKFFALTTRTQLGVSRVYLLKKDREFSVARTHVREGVFFCECDDYILSLVAATQAMCLKVFLSSPKKPVCLAAIGWGAKDMLAEGARGALTSVGRVRRLALGGGPQRRERGWQGRLHEW